MSIRDQAIPIEWLALRTELEPDNSQRLRETGLTMSTPTRAVMCTAATTMAAGTGATRAGGRRPTFPAPAADPRPVTSRQPDRRRVHNPQPDRRRGHSRPPGLRPVRVHQPNPRPDRDPRRAAVLRVDIRPRRAHSTATTPRVSAATRDRTKTVRCRVGPPVAPGVAALGGGKGPNPRYQKVPLLTGPFSCRVSSITADRVKLPRPRGP